MSFVQRSIDIKLTLANGVFSGGGNSMTLRGLRVACRISIPGGASMSTVEGAIYGMTLSQMNQLSTVGTQLGRRANNMIEITAGDAAAGMALVYRGTLMSASVDAQAMPQVAFRVSGMSGAYEAVKTAKPMSVNGSGDVAKMMGQLAQDMGLTFENNNVNVKLSSPYLSGSSRMQAWTLAQHAGIEHVIDQGTLAIWKPGQARSGDPVSISPQTGMVGYPQFNQQTIFVKTLFNPAIKFGRKITVKSDLTPACGTFVIYNINHELESMVPHGKWFTDVAAVPPQSAIEP